MWDIILEIIRTVIIGAILFHILMSGKREEIRQQEGWWYILVGFSLIFFGSALDLTDNFPSLNKFIIIGDTKVESFLEKVFGYLLGSLLLAIGFWKWMPKIIALGETKKKLKESYNELESKVEERTFHLEELNEQLRQEITKRKILDERFWESADRYLNLIENVSDVIYTLDKNGAITSLSLAFEKVTGWLRAEWLGKSFRSLIHPDDLSTATKEFQKILRGETLPLKELRILSKSGNYLVGEFTSSPQIKNGEVVGVFGIARDITERKKAEEVLKEGEEKYHILVENANEAIVVAQDGMLRFTNPKASEITGYSREEIKSIPFPQLIHPDDREMVVQRHLQRLKGEQLPHIYPFRIVAKNGNIKWVEINAVSINWEGRPATLNFINDITERKQTEREMVELQEQLRQSQKMEAIGRLAGGIAHDFNNLLTIIKGYSQLSLIDLKEGDPLKGNIVEIQKASERAADLTRQLLVFGRRQVMEVKVLDLNALLINMEKMLHRVIGEDIDLVTVLTDDLGRVKADPGQIENVIINLSINARDAMPSGGKLTIETTNVELDETYVRSHVGVKPGRYVMCSVSDTGVGMTPEVKERIFEPFFTTKEKDKGTGLGSSTVYGIVKQSGGNIWVYSEPGGGTTVKVYLPRVDEPLEKMKKSVTREVIPHGNETILVVEDEEEVRKLTVEILIKNGYKVLEASNGREALYVCEQHRDPIHLVVTDVVMPGMSGPELAKHLSSLRPEMKVLYMSGYTDSAIIRNGALEPGTPFLQKPFTPDTLVRKVRDVLDS